MMSPYVTDPERLATAYDAVASSLHTVLAALRVAAPKRSDYLDVQDFETADRQHKARMEVLYAERDLFTTSAAFYAREARNKAFSK